MNNFNKAARYILCTRMIKRSFSEEGAAALERLAETGQMPEEMAQRLIAKYQSSDSDKWTKVRKRMIQGLGIGGGLGLAGGAFRGLVDQSGVGNTIGLSLGSGLRNAGIGSLIGGGLGLAEAYFGSDNDAKEKEQIRRIIAKLQNSPATQEESQVQAPPEAIMANMQAQTMPGALPSITYNIHNFGPQAFSSK